MALSMGKAMDGNVSKESLLSQSQYYFDEIMKVHKSYVDNGTTKKNQLLSTKENERSQLSSELDGLKMQMEAISNQIVSKQSSLSEIDNKYANELTEVDCKLMANDVAKDKILSSINAVKQGLTNNLK
jgi:septal ring factor EnvC (AmiA/AmiB activator)